MGELENVKRKMKQDQNAAAAVRSRRDQVLSNRGGGSSKPAARNPIAQRRVKQGQEDPVVEVAAADTQAEDTDVRKQVLDLLEKYDPGKVDRIDIIMEKFKGKES